MARIKVGDVYSYGKAEGWTYAPDDRQEKIELINGVTVQDCGRIEAGDSMSCSATFRIADFGTLCGYWNNRTKVTMIDESGTIHNNTRVIVKTYSYVDRFPSYVKCDLEFWFC